jgi:hypothetical protein
MRVAAVLAAWLAPLAMFEAPVAVPSAYMDAPAPAAQARVAVDAAQVRAARPRERARATVPEPNGWTSLLCGLVAVAFIARR